MLKFDTNVQKLKYDVLRHIAKAYFDGNLESIYYQIPKMIIPGPKSTMRCCVYKERAIVQERVKLAMGGDKTRNNMVEVIPIACDECPIGGYQVTRSCRGCIAHRCEKACRFNAISFDENNRMAIINKEKCVNCGLCAKACQYNAILDFKRPCETACKMKAITMDENFYAKIDDEKCTQCGACVYQCPFGAIMDKSYITKVIDLIKDSDFSKKYHLYAIVAPSISAQYKYATVGQMITAIKKLGFHEVVEAALGADIVSYLEAKELKEKGFLTSSCCPSFVSYIKKHYPTVGEHVSHNLSPMAAIAKYIKSVDKDAKIVFIGPCIAKKQEIKQERVAQYVQEVLTFEELQALIDAREIDVASLEESPLDNASYYGRIFARTGGLAEAVAQSLREQNIEFDLKPMVADGVDAVRQNLNKVKANSQDFNFLEGMMCTGGCIGGPCCLTHEVKDKGEVDKYGRLAQEQKILQTIEALNIKEDGK